MTNMAPDLIHTIGGVTWLLERHTGDQSTFRNVLIIGPVPILRNKIFNRLSNPAYSIFVKHSIFQASQAFSSYVKAIPGYYSIIQYIPAY